MNVTAKVTAGEKEAIRLWHQYLRVALASKQPEVVEALESTKDFYGPWEMDKFSSFNEWWPEKKHLFADTGITRILTKTDFENQYEPRPQSVVLEVPLNKGVTELLKDIKSLLVEEFDRQQDQDRHRRRQRRALFVLSSGSQPKLVVIREMLSCYRDVYLPNPELRGKKLLNAVHSYYQGRKNKKWAKVPEPLKVKRGDEDDTIRAMRNLRRYIQGAETIVLNVAKGEFPGEH